MLPHAIVQLAGEISPVFSYLHVDGKGAFIALSSQSEPSRSLRLTVRPSLSGMVHANDAAPLQLPSWSGRRLQLQDIAMRTVLGILHPAPRCRPHSTQGLGCRGLGWGL